MPKLIFDIETVGADFDKLDEKSKEYLLKFAETEEEKTEAKEGMSFSPTTGRIVAIAILNPDTDRGAVYFQADKKTEKFEDGNAQYVPCADEKEILKNFWEAAAHYEQFITFNGRGFDAPFVHVRSAVHKIKPSRNLMPNRYYDAHLDLMDRLSFFGAVRRSMSLHMWCKAFGIESPKDNGVSGHEVASLFKDKKYKEIALYCYDDVIATKKLFEYWDKYINIK
jgi:hypothetical protein